VCGTGKAITYVSCQKSISDFVEASIPFPAQGNDLIV
jgi:hypothetical protein